ncbi:hypothetical protein H8356DRAFT_1326200 [Neocallimastix lanati (nom. inval.)]|nr:hypothetical protein H8356DRAFT_1326200 [Neocallimastix sp. JGI-2020a]
MFMLKVVFAFLTLDKNIKDINYDKDKSNSNLNKRTSWIIQYLLYIYYIILWSGVYQYPACLFFDFVFSKKYNDDIYDYIVVYYALIKEDKNIGSNNMISLKDIFQGIIQIGQNVSKTIINEIDNTDNNISVNKNNIGDNNNIINNKIDNKNIIRDNKNIIRDNKNNIINNKNNIINNKNIIKDNNNISVNKDIIRGNNNISARLSNFITNNIESNTKSFYFDKIIIGNNVLYELEKNRKFLEIYPPFIQNEINMKKDLIGNGTRNTWINNEFIFLKKKEIKKLKSNRGIQSSTQIFRRYNSLNAKLPYNNKMVKTLPVQHIKLNLEQKITIRIFNFVLIPNYHKHVESISQAQQNLTYFIYKINNIIISSPFREKIDILFISDASYKKNPCFIISNKKL